MRQDDSTVRKAETARDIKLKLIDEVISMYHTTRLSNVPAAIHILSKPTVQHAFQALESSPADGDGGVIRAAVIEECARVAEDQHADDWFEVGKVVVATGKRIAAAIRALTPTETGEVG